MSKALLQQHAAKALREREEQEKAIAKRIQDAQPKAIIPAPIAPPPPAPAPPAPVAPPPPVIITKTIVLPDHKALEEVAKIKSQPEQLRLEKEELARENSALKLRHELALKAAQENAVQEQARLDIEEQAQREGLVRENAALKLRYELALKEVQEKAAQEQARMDIEQQEQIERLTIDTEVIRKVSRENDLLKEELARLKKDDEEKKVPNEVLSEVLDAQETAEVENLVAPPPVYDEGVAEDVNAPVTPDDMAVTGHAEDLDMVSNNCSIS
jgi:hypothetical protein